MSYNKVPAGKSLPEDINAIIEIPAHHAPVKYEINEELDALEVDRFMATPMFYPANYGYIPKTLGEDGDPLDILVITPHPVVPGSIIRCRAVGVLKMADESGSDAKLIAVPHTSLTSIYNDIQDIQDVPQLLRRQISHFFENYKDLEEGKWVKVEDWGTKADAFDLIMKAEAAYEG